MVVYATMKVLVRRARAESASGTCATFEEYSATPLEPIAYRVRGDSPTLTDTLGVETGVDLEQSTGSERSRTSARALDESPGPRRRLESIEPACATAAAAA